ncbi:hypothetical protein BGX26_004341 [Mortierella sp. AD094]|nr:hypothetical protein BGX26_004341 [Mortierella sp. AD094]
MQDAPQPAHITTPIMTRGSHPESVAILRAKERPFFVAILRQSLYPITISVSGCIQIIADLTIVDADDYDSAFGYVANVATSIQGFLFFMVFMFDPALMQTRKHWRKYWIWKYYIEFYYGLGMPQEGRDFGERFMETCSGLNQYGNETKFDELTKPPSYSWTLQDHSLATPDFQTTHPLANIVSNTTLSTVASVILSSRSYEASSGSGRRASSSRVLDSEGHGVGCLSAPPSTTRESYGSYTNPSPGPTSNKGKGHSPIEPISMAEKLGNNYSNDTNNKVSATETDYTNLFQDLSPDAPLPPTNPDNEDAMMAKVNIPLLPPPQSGAMAILASHTGLESGVDETFEKEEGECSEPSSTSQPPNQRSYSEDDNDSDLFDDDLSFDPDLEGTAAYRHRVLVSAPRPGDVLSFPRIKRMTTIGGSELNPRRNLSTTDRIPKVTSRRMASVSTGRMGSFKDGSLGLSNLGYRLKHMLLPGHKDEDSVKKQYQTQFKYPRWAYLMHLIVRQVFIPRKARLPQITNPFKEHRESSNSSLNDVLQEVTRPHVPSPQMPDSIQGQVVEEQAGAVNG